jgi:hypothetical protein
MSDKPLLSVLDRPQGVVLPLDRLRLLRLDQVDHRVIGKPDQFAQCLGELLRFPRYFYCSFLTLSDATHTIPIHIEIEYQAK